MVNQICENVVGTPSQILKCILGAEVENIGCICGESTEAKQGDICNLEGNLIPKCAGTAELCTMEGY